MGTLKMEINKKGRLPADYLRVVIKQHWHMLDADVPAVLYELR